MFRDLMKKIDATEDMSEWEKERVNRLFLPIPCGAGWSLSIQANETAYSIPRVSGLELSEYTEFELGIMKDGILEQRLENLPYSLRIVLKEQSFEGVYPYVPASLVQDAYDVLKNLKA